MTYITDPLVHDAIGAAIDVHKELGPGLLESTYAHCYKVELAQRRISFAAQVWLPVVYKGQRLNDGYRLDLLIEDRLVVEVKAVEKLLPVYDAQVMTYLRLSGARQGLLFNFNEKRLKDGIRSIMLRDSANSVSLSSSNPSTVENG